MATYYVKNDGDNSKDGQSDANAWETIAYVNSQNFANDDVICFKRGSTFTDATLTLNSTSFGRSGITVQDYGTGNKPWIDGNSVLPIRIDHSLVDLTLKNVDISGLGVYGTRCLIKGVNGAFVDGVDCNGHTGAGTKFRCNAIQMVYVDGDIEIKNCTIQNLTKDTWADTIASWKNLDAHGILFWYPGDEGVKTSGTINVHHNNIHDVYADCIQTAGVRTTTNIYNNTLYNFGENAVDLKHARYIDIYNNEMYHGNSNFLANGGGYWGPAIVGSGLSSSWTSASAAMDNTIRYNYIHDCKYIGFGGIGDNAKVYGNYFKDIGLAIVVGAYDNTEIYNNIFELTEPAAYETTYPGTAYEFDWSTRYTGVALSGMRIMYMPRTNTKIYNNTIYISSSNHLYGITVQADADATGTIIKNNIIHMTRNNAKVFPLYIMDYDNSGMLPIVQYNNLYGAHPNRVLIEETLGNWVNYDATEQAAWRTAGHTGGLFTDPVFVNPLTGDLTLQSSSRAINAGADLGDTYKMALDPASTWPDHVATLDQNLHGEGWEIGAYVYGGAIPSAKGQIVSLTHPATVEHGAMCDINAAIKNIDTAAGVFKTQILINSILLATSAEFTLAGGATSTDKIDPFKAPLSGESMDIIIKCIRSE